MKYILSKQATGIVEELKEFDYESFFKWYEGYTRNVGTSYVLQYLEWRKNGNK